MRHSGITRLCFLLALGWGIISFYKVKFLKDKVYSHAQTDSVFRQKETRYQSIVIQLGKQTNYNIAAIQEASVTDTEGNHIGLGSLIKGRPRLVLRFGEYSCDVCYKSQIEKLKSYSQHVGSESIVLLVSFQSPNAIRILKETHGFDFDIFNINKNVFPGWTLESTNAPYYFLINSNGTCTNFLLLFKELTELNDLYLEGIKPLLK